MPRGGNRGVFRHEVVKARTPRPAESLTASAQVFHNGPGAQSLRKTGRRTRSLEYQNVLWDFYDSVPEYRFACAWVGNLLSKALLEVRYNGKPTTNQEALDGLASLFGGPEGQAEMLRLLGIHFTVAGEAYVVGTEGSREDLWEVIASVEVSNQGERLVIEDEPIDDDRTLAIRLWKAHPRRSAEADSPSRALMPILAEIVMLTDVVHAQGSSRLTSAGILWIPQEIDMPAIPVTVGEGDGETTTQEVTAAQALSNRLVSIASRSIDNRESAAAQVPYVVGAPGEHLDKIHHTEFWSGFDEHAKTLRDEAIRRIAIGMDMPPEVLTGTADVNHWGAWQIEEAAIKAHTEPLLEVILSSLTKGYLHPYLKDMGVEDFEGYTLEANTAALRLRPNRSKEAIELWDRGALSTHSMLIENGFDPETDRPDEKERIVWFLTQVAAKTSATPDQLADALNALGVNGVNPAPEVETRDAMDVRSLEQHPRRDMPTEEESESEALAASAGTPLIVDGIVLASEAHVIRALERAGNRLKNKVAGNFGTDAADLYMQVPALEYSECEALLEDAWTRLDRFSYPGVSTAALREALHEYTLFLLRSQKPMTRASLARHLMLELADQAA